MTRPSTLALFALLFGLPMFVVSQGGCSMTKIAADQTVKVMAKAATSFDKEHDLWLARQSATANLKFLEGVLEATPENEDLMVLIARTYTMYAFGFLEWDLQQQTWGTPAYEEAANRTFDFYRRGRQYAVMRMAQDFEDFQRAVNETGKRLEQILGEADDDHVAPLFWLAFSWGSMINIKNDDPDLLADLPRVKAIMAWVRDRDPGFENGGPHLFFGMINTALPKELGGKPEEGKAAYEKAVELTDGKYLMAKALFARYYMTAAMDKAGFERLLQEVLDAPDDLMPLQRLANEIAKVRARQWLGQVDEHFDKD